MRDLVSEAHHLPSADIDVLIMSAGRDSGRSSSYPSVALYVHVPFCRARCTYCDFNTYTGLEELMPAYEEGLSREIEVAGERWGALRVSTVYFGGGTPSLLPLGHLSHLTDIVRATFDLSACAEFTIEVNPESLSSAYLAGVRALGVSRLSFGAQSAHEKELGMLGRGHSWSDVVQAVEVARVSGFTNLNLDLLFGLPGQSLGDWRETLERALELRPEHLSLYGLTLEEGTPLARRIANEALRAPDDDLAATMYELAEAMLAAAGFFHYEISSWAKMDRTYWPGGDSWWPGRDGHLPTEKSDAISPHVCRHNMTYWLNEPWLGVGAGASSWMTDRALNAASCSLKGSSGGRRWANIDHPEDYLAAIENVAGCASVHRSVERIDCELEMGETMMLGLRLAEGVTAERFEDRFGTLLGDVFGAELTELQRLGLVTWDGMVARLTGRGRLLGNRVFERFI